MRRIYSLLFMVIALIAVQCVFLLIQENQALQLTRRFERLVTDHFAEANAAFMTRELSDMARLGLIRCFELSETDSNARPELHETDQGCGSARIWLGSSPVVTQVRGAEAKVWTVRFESLNDPEFYVTLWILRGLVIALGLAVFITARPPKAG